MAGSFLKCGYLKIKRPPTSGNFRIKAWQSKYFVLRDIPPIFEYFKDEFSFNNARQSKEKNKINLENVIHIGTTDASKTQRNAFMIVDAKKGAIMLAAESEKETKEWVDVLNKVSGKSGLPGSSVSEFMFHESEQSPGLPQPRSTTSSISSPTLEELGSPVSFSDSLQGFPVTTRLTPSSEKIGIRDDYTMYITDEFVAIHEIETSKLVVQWPIIGLRGWKSEPAGVAGRAGTHLLTLEAGRKSATGEGLFQFFSDFGNHVANIIRIRSNVLAEKFDKNKERSNSSEDPCQDGNSKRPITKKTVVKSATDPRPVKAFVVPSKYSLSNRSESESNIFDKKDSHRMSPSPVPSLRKEVLSKDIIQPWSENPTSPNPREDNTYLDLLNDKTATPVHITDSDCRKSLDSLSLNSDEGIIMQRALLNTVNELSNSQSYIDDIKITPYKKKQLRKRRSLDDKNDNVVYSDPTKLKSLDSQAKKTQESSSSPLCQDFLNQLSNPQTHQGNIFNENSKTFPSREQLVKAKNEKVESSLLVGNSKQSSFDGLTTEKSEQISIGRVLTEKSKQTSVDGVLTEKSKQTSVDVVLAPDSYDGILSETSPETPLDNSTNACQNYNNRDTLKKQSEFDDSSVHEESSASNYDQTEHVEDEFITMRKPVSSNSEKRMLPHGKEEAKDWLEKLVSNLESPQTCAQERIFPLSRRGGNDKLEKTNSDTTPSMVRHEPQPKKTIEKSKSHIGFDIKQQTEKPPPLPMRPEMASHARTKPSASLGDISKDLPRPLDFHKEIHRQLPWTSNAPALGAPCGPESLVHARLLHRSTSGSSLGALKEAHQITNHETEKATTPTFDGSRSRLPRGSVDFPVFNQENDRIGDDDIDKKRRGSKATMFLSRVLHTFNPGDSKRRGSCDVVSNGGTREFDLSKKGRSCSLISGGIVNEGWSPEQSLDVPSPEGSPLNLRRSLPVNRRMSHDPNMDRSRKIFIGSPTFDSARSKEEMRQRERAKERERERSELPNEPPPQLPPRKKSDPPPIPPRIRKSSSDSGSGPSSPKCKLQLNEASSNFVCDEAAPPPIPPRRSEDRRGSHPAPVIQLTMSSPEDKPSDSLLEPFPGIESTDTTTAGASTTQKTNNTSAETSDNNTMPHPIPQRPKAAHSVMTSNHRTLNTLVETETTMLCEQVSKTQIIREDSFVSIEMQERIDTDSRLWTLEERLEIRDIERDSVGSSPQPSNASPTNSHPTLHLQSSNVSSERYTPGHTPPMGMSLSPLSGGIVMGDSPTTPISV